MPGVGKKTAERLIVELRDRLSVPVLDGRRSAARCRRSPTCATRWPGSATATDEIRDVLRELPTGADSATLLRDALKALGARRA